MPHKNQIYVAVLSTSKSMYASGQPALYMADKDSLPFLVDHYQRVATGPTSVFVHDDPTTATRWTTPTCRQRVGEAPEAHAGVRGST